MQPPVCEDGLNIIRRRRRREVEIDANGDLTDLPNEDEENLTIEVFTGLYVNEDEEVINYFCFLSSSLTKK